MSLKSYTRRAKLTEAILLALFGAVMYVSQVIMAALPNIEIVSLLVIIITRKFGVKALTSIYVFVLCEIVTYGIEIWVINYFYVWTILWLIVYLVRKIDNTIFYTILSAIFGLFFGVLCSVPYFLIGGISMGIANIIGGIGFDLLHCGGNFIAALILYRPLTKITERIIKPI